MRQKRAVGYIRVAATDQSNPRRRLEAQAAAIKSVAAAAGINLLRVFEDTGVSAHNTVRPGLLALLAAVDAGLVDVVIVQDLSRLARDADHLHRLRETFDGHSVRVIAADELRHPEK